MLLYFAMNLYATIRNECLPEHSLDDLLSPLIQEEDMIPKSDLKQALFSFFDVQPDSRRGIVADIEAFGDLCMALFYIPEDPNCASYIQVITLITLLEFGLTLDDSLTLQTLLRQLADSQDSLVIPKDRLKCFLSGLAHLLVSIPATNTEAQVAIDTEVKKNTDVMEDQLLEGFLSFGNPENIQDDALRMSILEDQGDVEGVHVKLAATALSFLLLSISEQKNAKEIMDGLESILETDHPDTVKPAHSAIQQRVSLLLSFQADSSMTLSGGASSLTKEDIAVLRGFSASISLTNSTSLLSVDSQHVHLFSQDTPMGIFLRVGC